ncbi:MAG: FAD-dependent oxidoreductase, partial [Flavihumibacter sp.]
YRGQSDERLFWAGSTYENRFDSPGPGALFRARTEAALKEWLKPAFRVVDHLAAIRPATVERRPFVGMHPWYPRIGLLFGMGT